METTTVYLVINDEELISLDKYDFYEFSTQIVNQSVISIFREKQLAIDTLASYKSKNHTYFVVKVEIQEIEFLINLTELNDDKLQVKVPKTYLETFNENIVSKIKPIHILIGNEYDKKKAEKLEQSIELECDIYQYRLETFLETKSRKIIPFNYFDSDYEEEGDEMEASMLPFDELKEKAKLINTVDQAVDFLIQDFLGPKKIEDIKDQTILTQIDAIGNHLGINMYLRNLLFHGNDNTDFLKSIYTYEPYATYNLTSYGELGEGLIAEALWRKLHRCELEKIKNSSEIVKLNTYIDDVYENFYKERNLDINNVSDADYELIKEDLQQLYDEKSIRELTTKIKLLSYDMDEEDIKKYLALDNIEYKDDDVWLNNKFEMQSITGQVKEEEYLMFEYLKKEYFEIYNVYQKLSDFRSSKE